MGHETARDHIEWPTNHLKVFGGDGSVKAPQRDRKRPGEITRVREDTDALGRLGSRAGR
jgi:hypothetical protein